MDGKKSKETCGAITTRNRKHLLDSTPKVINPPVNIPRKLVNDDEVLVENVSEEEAFDDREDEKTIEES